MGEKRERERKEKKKREKIPGSIIINHIQFSIRPHKQIEKRREKGKEKREKREKMSRVNHYQSTFNSQKEKINILAEMLIKIQIQIR